MNDSYKSLYEAQKAEHEKTWEQNRKMQLTIMHLERDNHLLREKLDDVAKQISAAISLFGEFARLNDVKQALQQKA